MTTFADPSTFPSAFDSPTETPADATADAATADTTDTTDTTAVTEDTAEDATEDATEDTAEETTEAAPLATTFAELGLPAEIVRVLTREGLITPFEIQAATIPDALSGKDVLGRGQTGSGKTLAFGLPLLTRIAQSGRALPQHPRALILVPTRELAMQVADALMPVGRAVGVFLKTAVGGVPYDRQIDALRRGVEVIVATPGRLADLIDRGVCSLDSVEVTVLDEADQMADMGFLPEVTDLLAKTPEKAQRLLFSATLDGDVDALVKQFMHDPVTHSTAPAEASVSTMDHHLLLIPPHDKFPITAAIANRTGKTIVFARTQMGVDRLVEQLAAVGVRAGALHGGKTQRVRTRTLAEFKEGRTNVLVATDVAARGIHVDGISLVVHVDPPKDPKDYLHRAGRTARAGESGAVVTLVLPKQRRSTQAMMGRAGVQPAEVRVRLGDDNLAEITGARQPSGVPVVVEPEPRREPRPKRFGDRPRAFGDRPRAHGDRPNREWSNGDHAGGERRFGDRPQGERAGGERAGGERGRSYGDRPRSFGERPRSERSWGDDRRGPADRGHGDRPTGTRSYGDRSYGDRPTGDRPTGDRPTGDRPTGDRPTGDRSSSDERGFGGQDRGHGGADRGFAGHPTADRGHGERSFDRGGRNTERGGGFRRDGAQRNDRREGTAGRFGAARPARTF